MESNLKKKLRNPKGEALIWVLIIAVFLGLGSVFLLKKNQIFSQSLQRGREIEKLNTLHSEVVQKLRDINFCTSLFFGASLMPKDEQISLAQEVEFIESGKTHSDLLLAHSLENFNPSADFFTGNFQGFGVSPQLHLSKIELFYPGQKLTLEQQKEFKVSNIQGRPTDKGWETLVKFTYSSAENTTGYIRYEKVFFYNYFTSLLQAPTLTAAQGICKGESDLTINKITENYTSEYKEDQTNPINFFICSIRTARLPVLSCQL